jgi:hypothetical protein
VENLNDMKLEQGSLFDSSKESSLFYITTQRNLMSFLGAGMIVPASSQFRYKDDSRAGFEGAIPLWKGGLPYSSKYDEMIKDERAVIIECHIDDVMKYGSRFIVAENESVLVVNSPIPLWSVSAIYLSSQEVISDFIVRLPSDVIADRTVLKVLPKLKSIDVINVIEPVKAVSIDRLLSFIDSFGGGIKALEKFCSTGITNYDFILDLFRVCLETVVPASTDTTYVNSHGYSSSISEDDRSIFFGLLPILQAEKPEDGFDQVSLLEKLEVDLTNTKATSSVEINVWLSYVKKVIEAEKEVPVLADEGEKIKRAVLLFLLRSDLERLEASVNSSISPGNVVLAIAAFLSGFTTGLTRMGPEYKGDYRTFNKFTKTLLDSLWCKNELNLSVVKESAPNYGALQVYELNNEVVLKLNIPQNVILARVLNQAKSAGYNFEYDYENQELFYTFEFDGGSRHQTVYIELIKPLTSGFDVIRFVSPCMDLTGKKLRDLKKGVAIDFLKRNCEDSMYCSFAYSEKRKAIVVAAMQMVKTMDDDEFITLINYVANVADSYEKNILGLDHY